MKIYLSLALICTTAWLIPHIGIEIVNYRKAIGESPYWSQNVELQHEGSQTITRHALIAIAVATLLNIGIATGVGMSSQTLDLKAISIIIGLSQLVAAFVLFALSYKAPKWLGVYYSSKRRFGEPVGRSVKRLAFNVSWSIWRHFLQVVFIKMPFFCGIQAETIPVSVVLGIVAGFLIYFGVYVGRTKYREEKVVVATIIAAVLALCSALAFASGCSFIEDVWGRVSVARSRENISFRLAAISFASWLAAVGLFHLVLVYNTRKKLKEIEEMQAQGLEPPIMKYHTELFKPSKLRGKSLFIGVMPANNGEAAASTGRPAGLAKKASETVCTDKTPINEEEDQMQEVAETDLPKGQAADGDRPTAAIALSSVDEEAGDDEEEQPTPEQAVPPELLDPEPDPSTCSLIRIHCCGRAEKEGDREPKSMLENFVSVFKWFFSIVVNMLFIYFTIVNIGASVQTARVMEHLPGAFAVLYPPDYNIGPMCGWDFPGPNATIKTFATVNDTLEAGFEVVHCGECAACSTWNDLSLQWTTRTYLASAAQNCAKKSLVGTVEDVHQCNMNEIGFSDDCAWCWTEDELCAKKNCVFIFLQGVLINKLTNFKVGPGEITSATCDEAMCGPEFVPCSGATRRRMDITSSIPRPPEQQCRVIDQDWETIFNYP